MTHEELDQQINPPVIIYAWDMWRAKLLAANAFRFLKEGKSDVRPAWGYEWNELHSLCYWGA